MRGRWYNQGEALETSDLDYFMASNHVLSVISDCNPMDCNLPGSSVHGISQARILEWGANPGIKLVSPALAGRLFILLSHKRSLLYKYTGQILLDFTYMGI